jgi:hypothetical protein
LTSHDRDPNFLDGFPLMGARREGSSGRRTVGPLPPFSTGSRHGKSEPHLTAPQKRPYVRPRIGYSMLRSLWYLFAFAGVLAVAFMIPRDPAPLPSLDGNWKLEAQAAVAGLPPGHVTMLFQANQYALEFEGTDPEGINTGFERGEFGRDENTLVLHPKKGAYLLADGTWSRQLPPSRRLQVTMDQGRMVLTDDDGSTLVGQNH